MTNQVWLWDLIQETATGEVVRWVREGRPTPDGYRDFYTDTSDAYLVMRRKRD